MFCIDGDEVRRFISNDLDYSEEDRKIQIYRILGLSQIVMQNNLFPVASSVYMNKDILSKCVNMNINVVKIERKTDEIKKIRNIYKSTSNVVGVDIKLDTLNTPVVFNSGNASFKKIIKRYADKK